METRQIEFGALVKKARKELIESTLASRYSRDNPELFVDIVEGTPEDRHAIIPMVFGGQLVQYSPDKARKQDEKARKRAAKEEKKARKAPARTVPPPAASPPTPVTELQENGQNSESPQATPQSQVAGDSSQPEEHGESHDLKQTNQPIDTSETDRTETNAK